jgi:hypothetical protein
MLTSPGKYYPVVCIPVFDFEVRVDAAEHVLVGAAR